MPTAEARIDTPRAERYIAQLCDHLGHMGHGRFPAHRRAGDHAGLPNVLQVERDDTRAAIVFDWGRCTLTATSDALTLHAEADDEAALTRGQALIGRRIETIGRREQLTVTWRPRAPADD